MVSRRLSAEKIASQCQVSRTWAALKSSTGRAVRRHGYASSFVAYSFPTISAFYFQKLVGEDSSGGLILMAIFPMSGQKSTGFLVRALSRSS
ncbi:MAG: hypothetical protein ABII71_02970 [Candidatus Micrarchaeota archaeon]